MTYFLIEHDRRTKQSRVTPFKDRDASIRALNSKEEARDRDTDVVLLIAESEANIKITHPRYFWADEIGFALPNEIGFAKQAAELQDLVNQRLSDS